MVYPLVHAICKQKLFAVVRQNRFYCRQCKVFITAKDTTGRSVDPNPNTPPITEEEIYSAMRNGTQQLSRSTVFKLMARPKEEST